MAVVDAVIAMAVTAPVVFGVRGLPHAHDGKLDGLVYLLCISMCGAPFGLVAVTSRRRRLGGEKQDFENALPLADPEAIPAARDSLRRCVGDLVVLFALPALFFGLFWSPWGVLGACSLVPERVIKGVGAFLWERRHGVLLWKGRVEDQPLGKGRLLYSSPRKGARVKRPV
ncbi:hypothetical protein [Streptomyces sp. NPDC059371]|uniref:hypothetical protein n=1 Tax=Streptomyces sp. NPDC059371 TaxID=3346812 RepID=UPI0036C34660